MTRVLYAMPTYGHPRIPFLLSQRAVERTCQSVSFGLRDFAFSQGFVHDARNRAVTIALEQGYDYLLMHDDDLDVGSDPNPIDGMLAALKDCPGAAVIGAVYLREQPTLPTVMMIHPDYPDWKPRPELCVAAKGFRDEPRNVDVVGTGFMLCNVRSLKIFAEVDPGPAFRMPSVRNRFGEWTRYSDDVDFCLRLRRSGFFVLCDPRPRTVHYKEQGPLPWDRARWEADKDIDVRPIPQANARLREIDGLCCVDLTPCDKESPHG